MTQQIVKAIVLDVNKASQMSCIVGPHGENTRYLLELSGEAVFPKKYFDPALSFAQIKQKFNDALAAGTEKYVWNYAYQPEDLYYVKYEIDNGTGCQHFISGCALVCDICTKSFGCRYCHEQAAGIRVDEDHQMKVTKVKCLACEAEQPLDQNANLCIGCNKKLFDSVCQKCTFAALDCPFFHCQKCDRCVSGPQAEALHCEKCSTCIPKHDEYSHVKHCGEDDVCIICQGVYDTMLLRKAHLSCGHAMHEPCLRAHRANNKDAKCPVCRLHVSEVSEYNIYRQKWLSQYAMTEVSAEHAGKFVTVECLNCKAANAEKQKFVAQKHPKGYICPYCDSVNCSEGDEYKQDDRAKLIEEQNQLITKRNGRLIYPLVLDVKPEMPQLIEVYSKKYEKFWSEARSRMEPQYQSLEVTPMREMVETFFLVREIDERIGFAALNLVHTRGFDGTAMEMLNEAADAFAEVREVRRLDIM